MIGRTLSHYRILDEVSRGGMGVVYRALDVKLHREVALKILPPELVSDLERRRRFVQEAQAAAALEHPNIAVIHEIDEADGVTFIAMELVRGEKLRDLLERERLPLTRALDLAGEVAEGLARAHDRGVVHRDLKPANVMLTEDGHAKVIDFGLAKLVEPPPGASQGPTLAQRETEPGVVMGTVAYMSPEQARGGKVDHRSDIFSLGILLYEMLAGRLPFQRASGIETLSAILTEPTPRLPAPAAGVSDALLADLQWILDKCLAKEPAERYQGMRDVAVDLRGARRRLDSGSAVTPSPASRPSRRSWLPWAAALGALLLLSGVLLYLSRPSEVHVPSTSGRPSVAVLFFENVTGDPSLDWLHTGLTEMLVTDLSQSPHVEVLATERLYQILQELNRLDERVTSMEVMQEVATRAGVETLVLGSFMKAGENIRINIRVQEARSGKILATEKVEGVGESSVFSMVDDLSQRVRTRFDVPAATSAELDRGLKDVTTSSVEAYRYYAEGINLHMRFQQEEAGALFEKAIEVDPGFAMALTKLSVIHNNMGHDREAEEYARRALEHLDRLSARERYYIEGNYYYRRRETYDRAIAAYRKAVELYPDHTSARNNLALLYLDFERYEEAIGEGEKLIRAGYEFPGVYNIVAMAHSARGDLEKGHQVLEAFVGRYPENWAGHTDLAWHLLRWGKLDESMAAFEKADSMRPGHFVILMGMWTARALSERWDAAADVAERMLHSSDPFVKRLGWSLQAVDELYRGRSRETLSALRAAAEVGEPGPIRAQANSLAAYVLLETGRPAEALEQARIARRDGEGDIGEWDGLFDTALAQARLGRWPEAEEAAQELRQKADSLPTQVVKRRYHQLLGDLALARRDAALATSELELAGDMLPQRGFWRTAGSPDHAPIWFSLGSAHLLAGRDDNAATYFRRIVESSTERVNWPIPYVRSLYFLGKIEEKRGEREKAREYYRRFVEFWNDGDLDRERVEEAKSRISLLTHWQGMHEVAERIYVELASEAGESGDRRHSREARRDLVRAGGGRGGRAHP
jgi:serine/threonine protein kinase/tetratricopeptide (TPR) repeat protein